MILEHWFWWSLTTAAVAWYCSVTVYVAIRGSTDIKHMLQRLKKSHEADPDSESKSAGQ